MSTIRVKFVKKMEGKEKTTFLIVFLEYLLIGSHKFLVWGIFGCGI